MKTSSARLIKIFLMLAALLPMASPAAATANKPNLLLIYTDDERWDAIGYVTPSAHTPNLNRLARQGLRFTQAAAVLPVCSPSRAAVLTGRYGMANGQTAFVSTTMNPNETTVADYLRDAGYLTAQVGKWHIYGREPADCGFDEVRNAGNTKDFWQPKVISNGVPIRAKSTAHDYVVDETISIVHKAQESGQPFAIYLATLEPHNKMFRGGGSERMSEKTREHYKLNPLNSLTTPPNIYDDLSNKPPYLKNYRGRINRTGKNGSRPMTPERYQECQYASFTMMTELDDALGKLFHELERLGLMGNTYILFMGDNGLFQGEHGLMSKALHYEESVRVPFFAVGPGISSGEDNQSLVANIDIAPTLLDMADLPIPATMHGTSLKKLLTAGTLLDREYLLLEHPDVNPILETRTAFSLRSLQWKYIRSYENGKDQPYTFEELYSRENDPFELNNLIGNPEYAAVRREVRTELETQLQKVRANLTP